LKKLFILILLVCFFIIGAKPANAEYIPPSQTGYINDYAKVLSTGGFIKIDKIISDLKSKTNVEIFVVTLKSLNGYSIEEAGIAISDFWGLGHGNKGVIIIIAPNDNIMKIYVATKLNNYLPLGTPRQIQDKYFLPYFNIKNYNDGTIFGTYAIADTIAKGYGVKLSENINLPTAKPVAPSAPLSFQEKIKLFPIVFISILAMAIIWLPFQSFLYRISRKLGFRDEYNRPTCFKYKEGPPNRIVPIIILIIMIIYMLWRLLTHT
jgi:uncharacterized membrane protein YgcG